MKSYHQPLRAGKVAGGGGLGPFRKGVMHTPSHHNLQKILILLPVVWIVPNVGGNFVVRFRIADDVFVIIALPDFIFEWFPSMVFYITNEFIGCHGFKPLYHAV